MVKALSLSKKKVTIYAVAGVLAVCLFVATLFYLVPNNSQMGSVVFAMGPSDSSSPNGVYSMGFILGVTFANGSYTQNSGELNSTDIQQIEFDPTNAYGGLVTISDPYYCAFQFANDYQIFTGVTGETPVDLGMVDVVNTTQSFVTANKELPPPHYVVPGLPDYVVQYNYTGYWTSWETALPPSSMAASRWAMNITQIQSILANATDPVNIVFNLDLTSTCFYQLTTSGGTQAGTATEQYSGPAATLQLFHEGDQLVGLQFNSSTVSVSMTVS